MSSSPGGKGFSVRIFLPDGHPDGLKIVEKSDWTGHGLVFPRSLFAQAKIRPELGGAGVYVLVGPADESPLPRLYIGEADPVRPRLEHHATSKDFWTHAVAFTSKDQSASGKDLAVAGGPAN